MKDYTIDARATIKLNKVSPTNVAVASGNITLTFDAQKTNMNVEVRVS